MIPYCRHVTAEEEERAVLEVLRSGWIARGPLSRKFESTLEERLGASHVLSCSSGSAALEMVLRGYGIGPGDEVLVPSLSWAATAVSVKLVGARPVFIDIDPQTLCADASQAAGRIGPRTKAAIVVDFAGRPYDREAWLALGREHDFRIVEDAAHSLGASFEDGRAIGCDEGADAAVFSLHPAKTITTGEGGIIATGDEALAKRLRCIRAGGTEKGFEGNRGPWDVRVSEVGSNFHLTEIQAAIGLVQLDRIDEFLAARKALSARWQDLLAPGQPELGLPVHPAGSAHNLYIVQVPDSAAGVIRDTIAARLRREEIGVHMHYPLLHRQPVFRGDSPPEDPLLRHSVAYERRALTLPLHPALNADDQERVAERLLALVEHARPEDRSAVSTA